MKRLERATQIKIRIQKKKTQRERETIQSQRPLSSLSAQLAIQTRGLILVKIDLVVRLAAATFLIECTREASVCVRLTESHLNADDIQTELASCEDLEVNQKTSLTLWQSIFGPQICVARSL